VTPDRGSDCLFILFAGADTHHARHVKYENFTVADFAGLRRFHDGFHAGIDNVIPDHHLDFYLGQEIDHIFGTTIEFGVAFLTSKPFDLAHRHPGDADFRQRFTHVIKFEWFNNCIDLFHRRSLFRSLHDGRIT